MRRIGILGGTFDPIHLGHLIISSCAADDFGLDQVLFMPAQTPPHKRDRLVTDAEHRAHMVMSATKPDPRFAFSDLDMQRATPSYTASLLERLHDNQPNSELFFILGADSLVNFPSWHEPDRILEFASLAAARRPGSEINSRVLNAMPGLRERTRLFDSPLIDISSSDIRARVRTGKSISWLVPREVEDYILASNLYRR